MKDMADELLKLYAERKTAAGSPFRLTTSGCASSKTPSSSTKPKTRKRHRRRQARHGIDPADGPPALRRRWLRQNRNRHARRFQGASATTSRWRCSRPRPFSAFQHYETFKQRFAAFPVTIEMISRFRSPKQQKEILQKRGSGQSRHPHRHPPPALERCEVRRPRPAGGRRRTALRRPPQRTPEADAQAGGRADHVGHADSANAAHVAGRAARHERDRNATERSHRDPNSGRQLGRQS